MRRSVILPVILVVLGALLALRGLGSQGTSAPPKVVTQAATASPAVEDTAQEPVAAPPTATLGVTDTPDTLAAASPTATPRPKKALRMVARQATATKKPEPTATARPRKTSTPAPRATSTAAPKATSTPKPRPTSTPVPLLTMYVISPEGANLRGKPTTESEIRALLPYASTVQAHVDTARGADGARWYKVSQGSKDGYILGTLLDTTKPAPLPTATPPPTAASLPTSTPVTAAPVAANPPAPSAAAVGLPVRLVIDTGAVYVNTAVEYVAKTPTGAMDVPQRWDNVGWYRLGTVPGKQGNAVIAGHLDTTTGPAVFWNLNKLRPGDTVTVIDDRGQAIRFRVRALQAYYVNNAPLQHIFGNTSGAHLNLITCSGYFDRGAGGYDQRLVVYTDLIP